MCEEISAWQLIISENTKVSSSHLYLTKVLDEMTGKACSIKNSSQINAETWEIFLDCVTSVYFKYYSCPKLIKKISKLLSEVAYLDKNGLLKKMTLHLQNLMSQDLDMKVYKTVSYLMDEKEIGKSCCQAVFHNLIKKIEVSCIYLTSHKMNDHMKEELQWLLRLSFQIFQFPSPSLDHLKDLCQESIHVILTSLMKISASDSFQESSALAATAFFIISYAVKDQKSLLANLFQFTKKEDLSLSNDGLPVLSLPLIHGLLHCGKRDLLIQKISINHHSLLEELLPQIFHHYKSLDNHFQPLCLLLAWMKTMKICFPKLYPLQYITPFFDENSTITLDILQLIWSNWDSPLEGVPTIIREIFFILLELHMLERKKLMIESNSSFVSLLLDKLIRTPWYMKGKYGLLVHLIPYCTTEQLCYFSEKSSCLIVCLSVNRLAARSSEVYSVCLKKLRKDYPLEKSFENWKLYWMKPLLKTLCGKSCLLQKNICQYWVPSTLKIFPESLSLLLDELKTNISYSGQTVSIHAQIILLKYARQNSIINTSDMEEKGAFLREALSHPDDDLRADALSLICQSHKKAEALSKLELQLLIEFLPYNLNIDNTSFSQSLLTNIGHALVRIRDSSICTFKTYKNQPVTIPENIQEAVGFVNWLLNLVISSLFPGACYQRVKTCLDIYGTLLRIMTVEQVCKKKGCVPDSTEQLVQYIQSKRLWEWYSAQIASILLGCSLNSLQDIQKLAVNYLLIFPSSSPGWKWLSLLDTANSLLKQTFKLMNSAKTSECESGAHLLSFCFKKFVIDQKWSVEEMNDSVYFFVNQSAAVNGWNILLQLLIAKIRNQLQTAKEDLLKAATFGPVHGLFLGVHHCILQTISQLCIKDEMEMISYIVNELLSLAEDIIETMLEALGKNASIQDTAPSFAEMGEAINYFIQTSDLNCQLEENPALSSEHKLILACCWLNIKVSVTFLADITVVTQKLNIFTEDLLLKCNKIFIKVLTRCRHKGAIEACSTAYGRFCHVLLQETSEELCNIPRKSLEEALLVMTTTATSSSVTRRSAGLPMLIQNIVANEPASHQEVLLDIALSKLIKIAGQPLPPDQNDKCDLPQCHALYSLKTLFRDAALGSYVLPYVTTVMILAIDGFSSPAWAVRNAATLLFGCLSGKIMGQKLLQDETSHCNSITAQDFFVTYPELQEFLVSKLKHYQKTEKLSSGLFPILVLLSKLGQHVQEFESNDSFTYLRKSYVNLIKPLSSCPVYALRNLAASALLPFISSETFWDEINHLLSLLPKHKETCSFNQLHGNILKIQALLKNITGSPPYDLQASLLQSLNDSFWLLTTLNPCYLIRGEFIQVLTKIVQFCKKINDNLPEKSITSSLDALSATPEQQRQIGFSLFAQSVCHLYLSFGTKEWTIPLINSRIPDIMESTLEYLLDHIHKMDLNENFSSQIQESLLQMISVVEDSYFLRLLLQLIINLHQLNPTLLLQISSPFLNVLKNLVQSDRNTTTSSLAIQLLGLVILTNIKEDEYCISLLPLWTEKIYLNSQPHQSETSRLHASLAIEKIAAPVLHKVSQSKDIYLAHCCLRIFEALVTLLQDEESSIRKQATNTLIWFPKFSSHKWKFQNLQATIALEFLFTYMMKAFSWYCGLSQWMLKKLENYPSAAHILHEIENSSIVALFEQEDINIYQEPIILAELCYKMLEHLLKTQDFFTEVFASDIVMAHLQEIQESVSFFTQEQKDYPAREIIHQSKAFTALYRNMLWLKLVQVYANYRQIAWSHQVHKLIDEIKSVSGLHPLLHWRSDHNFKLSTVLI